MDWKAELYNLFIVFRFSFDKFKSKWGSNGEYGSHWAKDTFQT